jgi:hypothetical protein
MQATNQLVTLLVLGVGGNLFNKLYLNINTELPDS